MVSWFSTRILRQFNGQTIVFSTNRAGTTGYPYAKEWHWTPTSQHTKISSKWIQALIVKAKTIKLLKENISINLQWFITLDMTPKVQATKEKHKLDFNKIKKFCASKDSINKVERQTPGFWKMHRGFVLCFFGFPQKVKHKITI